MNVYDKLDHLVEFMQKQIDESKEEQASLSEDSKEAIGFEKGYQFALENFIRYIKNVF